MGIQTWTLIIVLVSFAIYIGIAIWARAGSTKEFYVAGGGVSPLANGMATAADWMSAASFISMAGIISFLGYDGSVYLMGWTGGYVLLALLLAPYLRKFGKFTVPDFVGDRYYSQVARTVAVICALFISFTYVAGQMRGVGVVFSRFLGVDIDLGVVIGMALVFFYATLGGMKGITYTQVAQYCVLIFAFMVPAFAISFMLTGNPVPQLGLGGTVKDGRYLLDTLDQLNTELGFAAYTDGSQPLINVAAVTLALMVGTAGLPHVIVRFFTVKKVRDARVSAFYALIFIAILYTTAPAIAVFSRTNLIKTVNETAYTELPAWFKNWETSGLIAWVDKNGDGVVQYRAGVPFAGGPTFDGEKRTEAGARVVTNPPSDNANELYVDRDIMVLANPEIANLPPWVIGLVAAGGLAAALSTAAGLLLVISAAISHDLFKKQINPSITEKGELRLARISAAVAVCTAGYFGIYPPGYVAEVVAFAFGFAAATFFPVIVLGIFWKKMNKEGAIAGMVVGLVFTAVMILLMKADKLGISDAPIIKSVIGIDATGIGTLGMLLNFVVSFALARFFPEPPKEVQEMVETIRYPRGAGEAQASH